MILLIDNYDSFVYNLARYFERLGHATPVVRNTAIDAAGGRGPASGCDRPFAGPLHAGARRLRAWKLVRRLHMQVPLLGICLGHQTIAAALGGRDHEGDGAYARPCIADVS